MALDKFQLWVEPRVPWEAIENNEAIVSLFEHGEGDAQEDEDARFKSKEDSEYSWDSDETRTTSSS